ncbi:MarR family transcriptional regulator [Methylococcus sp. ANG]|jgi:DNA-binding MarR family transcriptional regulator|uniref:MarR family winged helix-turn-helix transcriptional regulator n=1 Tax=unclassified Methylococcus TaxID=2618889 RepID=UPI001C532295|nr:MarR family transcriptional regulator [Methylococcus sp. Mc7]QXP82844.1 MarR family transcriptional regulator [Methylococcus sp. Mc7]
MEMHEKMLNELRRIVRFLDLQSKQLRKSGLTGSQLLILKALEQKGSMTGHQLSQAVNLSQGTITSVLDRLTAKALISRERSETDRRRLVIKLTDTGRQAIRQTPSLFHANFLTAFNQLCEWEQTSMLSTLQRLAKMMDDAHPKPDNLRTPGKASSGSEFEPFDDLEGTGC